MIKSQDMNNKTAWKLLGIFLIIHAVFFVWGIAVNSFVTHEGRYFLLADDAMISMTYARNLIDGNGLVWQPGIKVMGITNPGWTLIMALIQLTGLPLRNVSLLVIILNGIINLAMIYIIMKAAGELFGKTGIILAGFFSATLFPILFWSVHGFETPLQTLLITVAMIPLIPGISEKGLFKKSLSPIFFALAFVVRPDGLYFFAIGLLFILIESVKDKKHFRKKLINGVIGAAIIAAIFILQKAYYGEWLPNTFALKTAGNSRKLLYGMAYIADWLIKDGGLPLLLLSFLGFFNWIFSQKKRYWGTVLLVITSLWLIYVMWTGGDAFPHARFVLPILPIVILACVNGIMSIKSAMMRISNCKLKLRSKFGFNSLVVFFVGLWGVLSMNSWIDFYNGPLHDRVNRVYIAEAFEKADLPEGTKIALFEAGTLPFLLPQYEFIDLLGKSDRYVAHTEAHKGLIGHNKWDYLYSLGKLKPDFIVTTADYSNTTDYSASAVISKDYPIPREGTVFNAALWINPLFKKYYRANRVAIEKPYPTHWVFARQGAPLGNLQLFGKNFDIPYDKSLD